MDRLKRIAYAGLVGVTLVVALVTIFLTISENLDNKTKALNRQAFVIGCTWNDNSKGRQEFCHSLSLKQYP